MYITPTTVDGCMLVSGQQKKQLQVPNIFITCTPCVKCEPTTSSNSLGKCDPQVLTTNVSAPKAEWCNRTQHKRCIVDVESPNEIISPAQQRGSRFGSRGEPAKQGKWVASRNSALDGKLELSTDEFCMVRSKIKTRTQWWNFEL